MKKPNSHEEATIRSILNDLGSKMFIRSSDSKYVHKKWFAINVAINSIIFILSKNQKFRKAGIACSDLEVSPRSPPCPCCGELVVAVYWWDISADRIRMLSSLQFPCLVSSALFTRHSSSLRAPDSNRLPSDLEASSHRTTRVRVGTWLFNQCHYEKRRPPVPLVLRRSTVRVTQ